MRRLLSLLILLFVLPAAAGLFDTRPSATLGGLNNSADFLPVREAFRLSVLDTAPGQIKLRFVAAEGSLLNGLPPGQADRMDNMCLSRG